MRSWTGGTSEKTPGIATECSGAIPGAVSGKLWTRAPTSNSGGSERATGGDKSIRAA